jgi:chromosome segregation ATPase
MPKHLLLVITFGFLAAGILRAADAPSPAETRMRESLRNTMLQLRTSETERATLQAAQAESEQKNTVLTAQVEALTKRLAADKEAADKSIAELKAIVDERDTEVVRLNESLEKWKASQKQATALANATEAQRARLAANVIVLERRVADQQTKNAAMFKIGNEILARYEKFGLGDALTAREPFVGITRVKFENLMQDYQDKLADEKIKPADDKVPEQKGTPSPDKSAKPQASRGKASDQKARP